MRDIRALDNVSFADWFVGQGGSMESVKRMWDPIGAHGCSFYLFPPSRYFCQCIKGWVSMGGKHQGTLTTAHAGNTLQTS